MNEEIREDKVADSNNAKSAMYHSTINFSDKLHNSRLSKPAITCNNTLNIDDPEEPKIDNGTAHYQNVVQLESKVHYESGI